MLKVLGPKVLITLLLMGAFTGGTGYGLYNYLMPMRAEKDQELSSLKSAIDARRREVAQLKEEYILLKEQLEAFTQLGLQGFFNNQNRVEAQESFNKLGDLSGLLNTRYAISSGVIVDDPKAAEANYVVLKSPVTLDISSLDDVDVYTFVKALQERFPGNVDIVSVNLTRKMTITAPLLREIGSGDPAKMVEAKIAFDWRTMAPKDNLDEFDTSTSEGKQGEEVVDPIGTGGTVAPNIVDPSAPAPVSPAAPTPTAVTVPSPAAPSAPASPTPQAVQ